MSAAKWIKVVVTVGVFTGAASLWMVQRQTQVRLRAENQSLQRQLERMAHLEADYAQLSNVVAQADGSRSNQQLMELLRLRNEVGMLRRQTNELQKLREQSGQLPAAIQADHEAQASQTTNSPFATKPLAVYPKASWAFAGYATPEDAFQSLIWAASIGDVKLLLASCTADWQKEFAKKFESESENKASEEIKSINQNVEIRILTKDAISDNLIAFGVSGNEEPGGGENRQDKLVFQRVDGQWKLADGH